MKEALKAIEQAVDLKGELHLNAEQTTSLLRILRTVVKLINEYQVVINSITGKAP